MKKKMKEFEFAVTSILMSSLAKAADQWWWTKDFTKCNLYRIIDWQCPEDVGGDGKRYSLIPAT